MLFWEDVIGDFSKIYGASDFKAPFTYWVEILKKIESKFIIDDLNYHFSCWAGRIKNKAFIANVDPNQVTKFLKQRLSDAENYWLVLAPRENSKHYVYDCKIEPLIGLITTSMWSFYVVDKRYSWFVYFDCEPETKGVQIYKSGTVRTPFDVGDL